MKCPKCTTDFNGKPTKRAEAEPDMIRNLKGEDGKLYQKCNHCGFCVLEDEQSSPQTVTPSAKENQTLRDENAVIRAKATAMEAQLKDALHQLAESQKPVMEEKPVPAATIEPPPGPVPTPLTEVPAATITGLPKV